MLPRIPQILFAAMCLVALSACTGSTNGNETKATPGNGPTSGASEPPGIGTSGPISAKVALDDDLPVFSWEPVEGAASYGVIVIDDGDRFIWVWTGQSTTARFGQLPELPNDDGSDNEFAAKFAEEFGPSVVDPTAEAGLVSPPSLPTSARYTVLAFDADGDLMAAAPYIELP